MIVHICVSLFFELDETNQQHHNSPNFNHHFVLRTGDTENKTVCQLNHIHKSMSFFFTKLGFELPILRFGDLDKVKPRCWSEQFYFNSFY